MNNRQQDIYDFIKTYIEENQYSPTIREIGEKISLSPSSVHRYLDNMKEKGFINFVKSTPRTLRIIA